MTCFIIRDDSQIQEKQLYKTFVAKQSQKIRERKRDRQVARETYRDRKEFEKMAPAMEKIRPSKGLKTQCQLYILEISSLIYHNSGIKPFKADVDQGEEKN